MYSGNYQEYWNSWGRSMSYWSRIFSSLIKLYCLTPHLSVPQFTLGIILQSFSSLWGVTNHRSNTEQLETGQRNIQLVDLQAFRWMILFQLCLMKATSFCDYCKLLTSSVDNFLTRPSMVFCDCPPHINQRANLDTILLKGTSFILMSRAKI